MWLFFLITAISGSILHILIAMTPIAYTLLLYFFAIIVGAHGFMCFLGHTLKADEIAKYIGWPAKSPFQYEVACANLACAVMGILCIWIRGAFWLATAVGYSVFLISAGIGHIREIVKNKNYSPGNAGVPLYTDFIYPIILWALLTVYYIKK